MAEELDLGKSLSALFKANLDCNEIAFIYLGYAGILLRAKDCTIFFDPAELTKTAISKIRTLDFITYSHSHFDHYHLPTAKALHDAIGARIISEFSMVEELRKKIPEEMVLSGPESFRTARAEKSLEFDGVRFTMHPGVHPRPIIQFRAKLGNLTVFHGADSGYWPVGKQKVDVAFLPTGMPSPTCAPGVALAMAMDLRPKFAVAMHGTDKQHAKFRDLLMHELPKTTPVIPEMNSVVRLSF